MFARIIPNRFVQMDIRNDRTGEVIFKDSLRSAIAGVVKVIRREIQRRKYKRLSSRMIIE